MQGLNDAFDASLGLGGVGTNDLDVQFLHGASKLGHRLPASGTGLIDPKNAVFVAIEGHRLARLPEIAFSSLGIGLETFAVDELQLEQLPGGVVDEHQQDTRLGSPFKPIMRGTVNLYQLPKAGASFT